jgi:hypothetical protein
MSNQIAIIKEGIVNSIIIASDEFASSLSDTTVNVTDIECAIGWEYDGTNFSKPSDTTVVDGLNITSLTDQQVADQMKVDLLDHEITSASLAWRDEELFFTDRWVPITDHPDHSAILDYRQTLRDWPSTSDFPHTKPVETPFSHPDLH